MMMVFVQELLRRKSIIVKESGEVMLEGPAATRARRIFSSLIFYSTSEKKNSEIKFANLLPVRHPPLPLFLPIPHVWLT
jgi:hypothetical protein